MILELYQECATMIQVIFEAAAVAHRFRHLWHYCNNLTSMGSLGFQLDPRCIFTRQIIFCDKAVVPFPRPPSI